MPAVVSSTGCLLDTLLLQHCGHVTLAPPHAGGLKALVGDGEELRKAVEFGTACGAFVTQVCPVVDCYGDATRADILPDTAPHELDMKCILTLTCRALAQSSHSQQRPTSLSSLARTGISRRPQRSTLTCEPDVAPERCRMREG